LDWLASPENAGGELNAENGREAFVHSAYAGLYRWFCHLSTSPDRAADLTQETFTAFWASAGRRRADVSPTTWLYAIGRNLWRKQLRDRKDYEPSAMEELAASDGSPEQGAQNREFREAVDLAVSELPHDLREAFTLRFWHEFTYEQIGEVQGVGPGLARWRYFAARRRLHRSLAAWDPQREQTPEDSDARYRES
jgi:RNA polymerase sigma-70 factor (ECF subfamily)